MNFIKINKNDATVDARELHSKLEVKSKFHIWIRRRIKKYDFRDSIDFSEIINDHREIIDLQLSVGMAKELCMLENNDIGKRIRRQVIDFEIEARETIQLLIKENERLKLKRKRRTNQIQVQTGWQEDLFGDRWPIYELKPMSEATERELAVYKQKHRIRVNKGLTDKIYNATENNVVELVPGNNKLLH